MNYKASCPNCGARVTRGHYVFSWRFDFRCGTCAARFRLAALGYLIFIAGIGTQLLWYYLYRAHSISAFTAVGLVLLTFVLGVWLLPMVMPMKLKQDT